MSNYASCPQEHKNQCVCVGVCRNTDICPGVDGSVVRDNGLLCVSIVLHMWTSCGGKTLEKKKKKKELNLTTLDFTPHI